MWESIAPYTSQLHRRRRAYSTAATACGEGSIGYPLTACMMFEDVSLLPDCHTPVTAWLFPGAYSAICHHACLNAH